MNEDEEFVAWLEKVCQRSMPDDAMGRIRTLAKELAEGAAQQFWTTDLVADRGKLKGNEKLKAYRVQRWDDDHPHASLLEANEYLSSYPWGYKIEPNAFHLITKRDSTTIFISYKHSESSALALLIYERLLANGYDVFVDKDLKAGQIWHGSIEENIKESGSMILLLGRTTLASEMVQKEINWALSYERPIIPVYHNEFVYVSNAWTLPSRIDKVLKDTQRIDVIPESALGYHNALSYLLHSLNKDGR